MRDIYALGQSGGGLRRGFRVLKERRLGHRLPADGETEGREERVVKKVRRTDWDARRDNVFKKRKRTQHTVVVKFIKSIESTGRSRQKYRLLKMLFYNYLEAVKS